MDESSDKLYLWKFEAHIFKTAESEIDRVKLVYFYHLKVIDHPPGNIISEIDYFRGGKWSFYHAKTSREFNYKALAPHCWIMIFITGTMHKWPGWLYVALFYLIKQGKGLILPYQCQMINLQYIADTGPFLALHDNVIKWKHFPRYWPLVRGIHRSTVNSSHKGMWRGDLMFSLICASINS